VAAAVQLDIPLWAFLVTALAPWAAVLATAVIGLRDIAVKARTEAVEADVKLLQAFTALATIADAREGAFLSETVAAKLVESWDGESNLDLRPAVANGPVSAARRAAVLTGIAELARGHRVLRSAARTMLDGLHYLKDDENVEVREAYQSAKEVVSGLNR
jgi:hypothetical protein